MARRSPALAALLVLAALGAAKDKGSADTGAIKDGAKYEGTRTNEVGGAPDVALSGKATVGAEKEGLREVELRLKAQDGRVELWTLQLKGNQIKLTDVQVVKGKQHFEQVEGTGAVQDGVVKVEYKWRVSGPAKKNQEVRGILTVKPAKE